MSKPLDLLGGLTLEDGRRWGEAAYDFQLADARAVLEGAEPYHFLTRSRGSSKTTDLGGVATAVLLTSPGRLRSYWLAADSDQGRLAIDCIAGFASRSSALRDQLDIQTSRVVVPETGAVLEVLAADAPSAWGLNPHWLFVDELANWKDGPGARRLWEAASSAAAKRVNCRMVVLTTAGSPDHFAFRVLEHARTSSLWRVSERLGPAPWMDADRLAEQRRRLPESVYRQLFENEWTAAEGSFLDPEVIESAFCLSGPGPADMNHTYFAGLDLGTVNDRTVLAIGHHDGERVLLDRMVTWKGSRRTPVDFADVERTIAMAHRSFGFKLRLDPWQGFDLAQRLRTQGVTAEEFNFSPASKQRLAGTLLSAMNSGTLALYDAEGLRDELLALRLVQTSSGAWAFDHARSGHDDRATALALMTMAALADEQGAPIAFASLPGGGGWTGGDLSGPTPGTAAYDRLTEEEQYEACLRRAGLAADTPGFTTGSPDRGYDSPGAPAWLTSGGNHYDDW